MMQTSSEDREEDEDEDTRYFEVDFDPGDAVSFERPTETVMETIRELMESLPVESYIRDPLGLDALENASMVGSLDEIVGALRHDLESDYQENTRELKEIANFKTYVIETEMHPDALDIITELSDKDESGRAIMYGSRVRRIADDRFALWSSHG
jgi:hypothetical protein